MLTYLICSCFDDDFFVYIKNIGLYLSFLVLSLFLLVIMALLNELATIPSSYVFWKSLQRIGINSFNVWWNLPVKIFDSELLFFGSFQITDSIHYLLWIYFDFLFFLKSVLQFVCFEKSVHFISRLASLLVIQSFILLRYNLLISVKTMVMFPR